MLKINDNPNNLLYFVYIIMKVDSLNYDTYCLSWPWNVFSFFHHLSKTASIFVRASLNSLKNFVSSRFSHLFKWNIIRLIFECKNVSRDKKEKRKRKEERKQNLQQANYFNASSNIFFHICFVSLSEFKKMIVVSTTTR